MKCFVIGSNSFAGASFVSTALSLGYNVVGISRSDEPHSIFLPYKNNPNLNSFKFYKCDLNKNFNLLRRLISDFEPKFVVDFAGQGMVAESWKSPEQWYQTNIVSKVKLHHYLNDCKWLKKYIRVSTPEVYGSCDDLIKEDATYNPSTPYAVSHAATDMSLKAYHKNYSFPVVFTRFANFYGPSQQLYRIIPRTIIYAKIGEKLQLHGGGKSVRAFIHSSDVADGIIKTIESGKIGATYHFSTEEFVTIRDLVIRICKQLSVSFDDFIEEVPDREGKDQAYFMDCQKAKEELGWKPKFDLESGLKATVEWVNYHIKLMEKLPLEYIHKK